jgi:hypothetical protein
LATRKTTKPRHQQWPRACLGFNVREPDRVQLRVPLRGGEGVCDVIVVEKEPLTDEDEELRSEVVHR